MGCYCGSDESFEQCCELIISGHKQAETPEQLMRSRYSAYATENAQYIYNTYAEESIKAQSLTDIEQWAQQTQWIKLTILYSDQIERIHFSSTQAKEQLPSVKFSALYIHEKKFCLITENSRFIVEDEQWVYLDGDITEHDELVMPKRNAPCLCQSNKKFKHCCAIKL